MQSLSFAILHEYIKLFIRKFLSNMFIIALRATFDESMQTMHLLPVWTDNKARRSYLLMFDIYVNSNYTRRSYLLVFAFV